MHLGLHAKSFLKQICFLKHFPVLFFILGLLFSDQKRLLNETDFFHLKNSSK